jgi:hypothetical protein
LHRFFNDPYVLNLGDLPGLTKYPFAPAGPAVSLEFPAPPGPVAVGGLRRLPVTVAIQDEKGRTVRPGSYTVTLALDNPARSGLLTGTMTATTVNGIATFTDLRICRAGNDYRLVASADGLRSATSPAFQVGPGAGITRDWWTGFKDADLTNLDHPVTLPAGTEIVSKALEMPVHQATNFGARYRAFLIPPITGTYHFWIANENVSKLMISPDSNPAHLVEIAAVTSRTPYSKWPHTHEAESVPVNFEAGKRYYLEVLQAQSSGSTQLAVRWRLPNGVDERPIPGWRFAPPEEQLSQNSHPLTPN